MIEQTGIHNSGYEAVKMKDAGREWKTGRLPSGARRMLILFFFTCFLPAVSYAQHESHQTQSEVKQEEVKKKNASKKAVYYCPMHPAYISDRPGDCPICNMKLVKKTDPQPALGSADRRTDGGQAIENDAGAPGEEPGGFYVSTEKQQLIGVKTDKVIYRPLSKIISTVGRVAFDPDLYKAQQEYIEAVKTLQNVKESFQESVIKRAEALVEAAKLKLKLQGLDIKQIEELAEKGKNDESLLISSPESDFTWVYAVIYEYELERIKIGQDVIITATAYPAKEFKGKVVAIDPVFNAMTRSVRARIKVDNVDGLLKPEMFVDVQMQSDLGAHLSVPREAIMDSGLRKIVFLSLNAGRLKPVEVKTGFSTEEYIQVLEGLKEGDTVVVSGNFLIDSESKLKSALEGTGHQHSQ